MRLHTSASSLNGVAKKKNTSWFDGPFLDASGENSNTKCGLKTIKHGNLWHLIKMNSAGIWSVEITRPNMSVVADTTWQCQHCEWTARYISQHNYINCRGTPCRHTPPVGASHECQHKATPASDN